MIALRSLIAALLAAPALACFAQQPAAGHAVAAARVWGVFERGNSQGFLPAHAFTTIHYLATRARGRAFARRTIDDLLRVFDVAAVDGAVIRKALSFEWPDFEDAVCAASASSLACLSYSTVLASDVFAAFADAAAASDDAWASAAESAACAA